MKENSTLSKVSKGAEKKGGVRKSFSFSQSLINSQNLRIYTAKSRISPSFSPRKTF